MQKRCIRILVVHQAALLCGTWDAMMIRLSMYFDINSAYPVEPTRSGAATLSIQNIMEKEDINAEKMLLTSKLKPSHSQNAYLSFF